MTRAEQARAEAERRWPGKLALAPIMQARFIEGVVWADANPKPRTITQSQAEDLSYALVGIEMGTMAQGVTRVLDVLGIEVEDDDA